MVEDLLKKPEAERIVLGDGETYVLAPIDLGVAIDFEAEIVKNGMYGKGFVENLSAMPMAAHLSAMLARLKRNYPEMTREDVGRLISSKELMRRCRDMMLELAAWVIGRDEIPDGKMLAKGLAAAKKGKKK